MTREIARVEAGESPNIEIPSTRPEKERTDEQALVHPA
jgi:hypothetical protein